MRDRKLSSGCLAWMCEDCACEHGAHCEICEQISCLDMEDCTCGEQVCQKCASTHGSRCSGCETLSCDGMAKCTGCLAWVCEDCACEHGAHCEICEQLSCLDMDDCTCGEQVCHNCASAHGSRCSGCEILSCDDMAKCTGCVTWLCEDCSCEHGEHCESCEQISCLGMEECTGCGTQLDQNYCIKRKLALRHASRSCTATTLPATAARGPAALLEHPTASPQTWYRAGRGTQGDLGPRASVLPTTATARPLPTSRRLVPPAWLAAAGNTTGDVNVVEGASTWGELAGNVIADDTNEE
eukprot:gene8211-427_t